MNRRAKILTATALTVGLLGSVGVYAKHRMGDGKRAEFFVSYVSEELNLDTTQEQALTLLKDEVIMAKELLREEMEPLRSEVDALLRAETFDQNRALELISGKTATINESAPTVIAALGNFLDGLDAEQKAEVLEHFESRRGHGHRFRRGHHD